MKVGVYYDLRNAKGWFRPYPQFYAEALEHMQAMDELGMHSLNFSEHHFDPDGYCPSVIVWSAAAAVRTKRAKISQNLVLIPFLHPVRLAEDIATIDILSNGRAWLMAGTGHRAHEFAAFGVERKERTPRTIEGMEIIRKCFTEEEFSYAGKYYNLQNVRMQPRPVQKPHPPMFWGTTVYKFNLRPLERIVEHGFGAATAMGVSFPPDLDAWENWYEHWIGAIRRLGKDPAQYQTTTILTLWVTDDPEREWRKHRDGLLQAANSKRTQSGPDPAWETPEDLPNWRAYFQTPNDAAKYLRRMYGKAPLSHLLLVSGYPSFPFAEDREHHRLFADKVTPQIRDLP